MNPNSPRQGRISELAFNLTPLQGESLLGDVLPGVKTPGLLPLRGIRC